MRTSKVFFIFYVLFCFLDSVFKGDTRDGIKDISIDCFGRKMMIIIVIFSNN